ICVCPRRLPNAGGNPRLRLIAYVAQKLNLYLVGGVEPVRGAIGLVQRAEIVSGDAVKVEIVAAARIHRTGALRTRLVAAARTESPVVFLGPGVPSLVHEIACARPWVCIRRTCVIEQARGLDLV